MAFDRLGEAWRWTEQHIESVDLLLDSPARRSISEIWSR